MPIEVIADVVEQSDALLTTRGWEVDRVFLVRGLDGLENQRHRDAVMAAGLPQLGDPHPSIPLVRVESLRPQAKGADTFYVIAHYAVLRNGGGVQPPVGGSAELEVGASLHSQREPAVHDGERVRLKATMNAADTARRPVYINVLRPLTTVTYTRTEDQSPAEKAREYVGKVNATTVFEDEPGTWLCTSIRGRSSDGGLTYVVQYNFEFNPDKWEVEVYAPDLQGSPSADAGETSTRGHTWERVVPYASAEFRDLGI